MGTEGIVDRSYIRSLLECDLEQHLRAQVSKQALVARYMAQ